MDGPQESRDSRVYYLRAGGVPTRHTHNWDGLHTRHLLESTHTNTHKQSYLIRLSCTLFSVKVPSCV